MEDPLENVWKTLWKTFIRNSVISCYMYLVAASYFIIDSKMV